MSEYFTYKYPNVTYIHGRGGSVVIGWGDRTYAARQSESTWITDLDQEVREMDPENMEPIRAWKLSARPQRPMTIKGMSFDVPTEIPLFAVVRYDHTRGVVVHTPDGVVVTSPLPMEKAMKAQQRITKFMAALKVVA